MAADLALFEFGLKNGELFGIRSIDESQVPAAERVVDFAGSQLRIDLADLDDASVRGKLTANDAASSMLYTFELEGMEWDFRERQGKLELVGDDNDLLQNEDMPLDTNGNGTVEPLDVLSVINFINSSPTTVVPIRSSSAVSEAFVDVNGDNVVSPMDVLMIINQLNSGSDDTKMPLIAEDDYFERT
ncbi:MAG: dockerin type I domain-containing protein [Planctomycetota bacterium]